MTTYTKFESGGRFGLRIKDDRMTLKGCGDLGTGSADRTILFQTEEGRDYFISYDRSMAREIIARQELSDLKVAVLNLIGPKGRVRKKAVRKLFERLGGNALLNKSQEEAR